MRKIAILSDTHGHIDEQILKFCRGCDEIWHAGDVGGLQVIEALQEIAPLRAVYGNIDDQALRRVLPEHLAFEAEELQVFMTHIGALPPRYSKKIKDLLDAHHPQLFVCGHSHILRVIPDPAQKLLYINPGAAGHHGFHNIRTMLHLYIAGGKAQKIEVIELGKRGQLVQN
jgi:putative phosphoesterase